MVYGFSADDSKNSNGVEFGMVVAINSKEAKKIVKRITGVSKKQIELICAEDLVSEQYQGFAFLTTERN